MNNDEGGLPYKRRTSKQWEYMWEHACNANVPMREAIMANDRKIETILNLMVDREAEDSEKVTDVVSKEMYSLQTTAGVGSYIVGHGDGWVEAVLKYKGELEMFQMAATMAIKGIYWVIPAAVLFGFIVGWWVYA